MPKKSKIVTDLAPEIRAELDRLIREGGYTTDSLVAMLKSMGGEASRSSVGRYAKNRKEQMETYSEAQDMARSLQAKFKEDPDSDLGRMLAQLWRGVIFKTINTMSADEKTKASELMLVAAAIKNLAGADKIALEQAIRIRKQTQEEIDRKITALAEKKPGGGTPVVSPEALKAIREQVYGITAQPA